MARLGDICTIKASNHTSSIDRNWLLNLDVVEQQTGKVLEYNYVTESALDGSIVGFDTNNVLYSKLRPNLNKVVVPQFEGYATSEMLPLYPDTSKITREYLAFYLRSPAFVQWAISKTAGAKMPRLGTKELLSKDIPLPTLGEQNDIVILFDRINALISLRKKQLQKLNDLVKSRFVEMFGDPKINPNNYLVACLGEHITFLTSGSRGWAKYCVEDGKEWFITIKNVKDCAISVESMQSINAPSGAEAERTRVQEGDLLISITADLGRTGVVTKHIAEHGAYINQHLTCIRLDMKVLNPLYVAYFMETPAGKEQFEAKNQSAVKAGLNFNSINSLRIIIPPIDKQNEFVTFVKHVDKSRLTIQKGLDKLELLKQSLMQKYFG